MPNALHIHDGKPISEVFNPARVERHLKNNNIRAIAVFDIVRGIILDGSKPIEEVRAACKRKQPHQAVHILCNFRACLTNLGGMRCCDIAVELEDIIEQHGSTAIVNAMLDCLDMELKNFIVQAGKWLAQEEPKCCSTLTGEAYATKVKLDNLYQALIECNFVACERFSTLYEVLQARLTTNDFFELELAIQQLNFKQAARLLQQLL